MLVIIVGLDIGGTKTAVVVGDSRGTVHRRTVFPTAPRRGFDVVFTELLSHVDEALRWARAECGPAEALSVSIGGPLAIDAGIILSPPHLPGWDRIPLKQLLSDRYQLPVYIEHDGNAGALAEFYFGAGRGARNLVFLTMGTGFGGGLILDGRVYRGSCDLAGEVGHIRLAEDGPVGFGKAGSWEGFCAGAGITKLAALRYPARWREEDVTVPELAQLARDGDPEALAVFDECGKRLGQGLALLLDILNPDVIVIGALAVRLGELVLAPARRVMKQEALPGAYAACRVLPAALGEQIGDIAALCAAIAARGGPCNDETLPSPPAPL